ncbi:MAG: endonuclease III, partial [Armatimonadota bacterium]|nr:endonuclease III [Armatimonadota bacterium]
AMAQALVERHNGEVPSRLEELVQLPGVGRKTANVVLCTWFQLPAIPVDTHVTRLAGRLGLTASTHPDQIEEDLQRLFPKRDWGFVSHALIWHGRRVCYARKPACARCCLRELCPSATA